MAEDKFEQAVIEKLKSEGWEYLTDYSGVTVDRLYDHWWDILNANNRKRLEDTSLSDNEFEQVKLELTKNKTPYDAQLMLAGAGGVGTVPLNLDDGTQLELEIFYGDEVAGGHSRYEVVNQITFTDLATSLSSKRRIDIMLLAQGIFRYNISKTKMMDIKVPVPLIEEQEVVGRFFSNIDNLIAANQRKLDLLKEQKKGFLQNMFV